MPPTYPCGCSIGLSRGGRQTCSSSLHPAATRARAARRIAPQAAPKAGPKAPAAAAPSLRQQQPVTISPARIAGAMRDVAGAVQEGQVQAATERAEREYEAARAPERQATLPPLASEIRAATERAAAEERLDRQREHRANLEYLASRGIRL